MPGRRRDLCAGITWVPLTRPPHLQGVLLSLTYRTLDGTATGGEAAIVGPRPMPAARRRALATLRRRKRSVILSAARTRPVVVERPTRRASDRDARSEAGFRPAGPRGARRGSGPSHAACRHPRAREVPVVCPDRQPRASRAGTRRSTNGLPPSGSPPAADTARAGGPAHQGQRRRGRDGGRQCQARDGEGSMIGAFGVTHPRRVRTINEDALLVDEVRRLFLPAGRHGRAPRRDVASRIAVETVQARPPRRPAVQVVDSKPEPDQHPGPPALVAPRPPPACRTWPRSRRRGAPTCPGAPTGPPRPGPTLPSRAAAAAAQGPAAPRYAGAPASAASRCGPVAPDPAAQADLPCFPPPRQRVHRRTRARETLAFAAT